MVQFSKFLFTRDVEDYGFRIRPEDIPDGFIKKYMPMIDMPDMSDYIDYTVDEWKNQYLVTPSESNICISRIIKTDDLDPVTRPIIAFEGIIIQPGGYRGLLEIFNVIHYMNTEPSFYDKWKNGDSCSIVEVDEVCNPLLVYSDEELEDLGITGDMKKIYEMIHSGTMNINSPFVIHNNKPRFSEYLSLVYNASEYDISNEYCIEISEENWTYEKEYVRGGISNKNCQVLIRFHENKKGILGYEWIVKDLINEKMLGKTKWCPMEREENLNEIVSQGEKIKLHFRLLGYFVSEGGSHRREGGFYGFIN